VAYTPKGAHIKPLGRPHNGLDVDGNVLCLCPNHHAQLDKGGITIGDDRRVIDCRTGQPIGPLYLKAIHRIDLVSVAYHRSLWPLGR
jgi:putative restriction endonuclease